MHSIRRRKLSVCSSYLSPFHEVQIWVMAPKLGCVELGVKACFAFRCEKDSQPLCMLFWWANSMRSEGTRSAVSIIAEKQQIVRLRFCSRNYKAKTRHVTGTKRHVQLLMQVTVRGVPHQSLAE